MDGGNRRSKSEYTKNGLVKRIINKYKIPLFLLLVVVIGVPIVKIGMGSFFSTESNTTKIKFENIGELATQSAYTTEVNITDASRDLFGIKIPFTQSKLIYSYNVQIKAGFDFEEIDYKVNNDTKTIKVKLPKPKILSTELDHDSFKVYHESESIFKNISLAENNEALKDLTKNAEKDAVDNGLLDNAKTNAEMLLQGFFTSEYDMKEYKMSFSYN